MNHRDSGFCLILLLVALTITLSSAWAGGPLYVTGLDATHPGQPYRWSLNPIPYHTDIGGLGNQTNAQANDIVASAFKVWQDVGTANIQLQNAGSLAYNVTSGNILNFQDAIWNCSDARQPAASIVYDLDGSAMTELGLDNDSILGFSGIICTDDRAGVFKRGWALMNGRFIDGRSNHNNVSLEEFKTVFVHEFGHLLGLDHSQINLNCMTGTSCTNEDMAGLPIMFPILLDGVTGILKTDDMAAISMLYPAINLNSTMGRIQGRVLFSDGQTPAQGYNVIARKIDDPRRTAVSCVSGFLFTSSAGNALTPYGDSIISLYGSNNPTLIGYYDLPGLPPGAYIVEVEAINNSGDMPFTGISGVGPIGTDLGYQYKMPGICSLQYLNYPSSLGDSCSAFSFVLVGAGQIVNTYTDVIFLGTPPRYDEWENGN